jgi:hypothetical protein
MTAMKVKQTTATQHSTLCQTASTRAAAAGGAVRASGTSLMKGA